MRPLRRPIPLSMKTESRLIRLVVFSAVAGGLPLVGAPGDLEWFYSTQGVIYSSPAIDEAGNVYVGSEDGDLYSLTAEGQLRWVYGDATDWIDSSPAVGPDGTVYVGSWDGDLYAVNGDTGALRWKYETEALVIASPAIGPDGTVYVVSFDGGLHALSPSGTLRWIHVTDGAIESSPAVDAEGTVYFGNEDGLVFAVDAQGVLKWQTDLSAYSGIVDGDPAIHSSPALSGLGELYIGTRQGIMASLDTATGDVQWTYPADDYIDSSPAVGPFGDVVFAARDGYLYRVSRDGSLDWEILIGDVFYASPAIDKRGRIYVASYLGGGVSAMLCVSPDGVVLWNFPFEGYNDSSPNLGENGMLYFGAHNFDLYALETDSGLNPYSPWPRFGSRRDQSGRLARVPLSTPSVLNLQWDAVVYDWVLAWPKDGSLLYQASSLAGPWTLATDQANPRAAAVSTAPVFYRVGE